MFYSTEIHRLHLRGKEFSGILCPFFSASFSCGIEANRTSRIILTFVAEDVKKTNNYRLIDMNRPTRHARLSALLLAILVAMIASCSLENIFDTKLGPQLRVTDSREGKDHCFQYNMQIIKGIRVK